MRSPFFRLHVPRTKPFEPCHGRSFTRVRVLVSLIAYFSSPTDFSINAHSEFSNASESLFPARSLFSRSLWKKCHGLFRRRSVLRARVLLTFALYWMDFFLSLEAFAPRQHSVSCACARLRFNFAPSRIVRTNVRSRKYGVEKLLRAIELFLLSCLYIYLCW